MRPKRLELEGFASFRERTEIDFEGADLFALVGPTGAGKSSILDAIVFSLYGCVPRYDDRRAVGPAISQGRMDAKVRLDFTVGSDDYTAFRWVRRTNVGGTTREARLERNGEPLAGNADEVTRKAEEVLGLSFEQFTRCVLLPQGDFAQFLHDSGKDKNELLRRLLGADLYRKLFQLAGAEVTVAEAALNVLTGQLQGFADATPENLAGLGVRSRELEGLKKEIDALWPRLEAMVKEAVEHSASAKLHAEAADKLARIELPPGIADVASAISAASKSLEAAEAKVKLAQEEHDKSATEVAALPPINDLEAQLRLYADWESARLSFQQAESSLEEVAKELADARGAANSAEKTFNEAQDRLTALQLAHAAFHVAANLKPGESCPVCGTSFKAFPGEKPSDFDQAVALRDQEQRRLGDARGRSSRLEGEHGAKEKHFGDARARLAKQQALLAGLPDAKKLEAPLERARLADLADREARTRLSAALRDKAEADRSFNIAKSAEAKAQEEFEQDVHRLQLFEPPLFRQEGLGERWTALVAWAEGLAAKEREEVIRATRRFKELETEAEDLRQRAKDQAARHEIAASDGNVRDACIRAVEAAHRSADNCRMRIAQAQELQSQAEGASRRRETLKLLHHHLRTDKFEAWVLNRSFRQLADAASVKLRELSKGQYSLAVTSGNDFEIVDHINANERRSVRTLSGGETFLASLSLALSLAEQVAMRAGSTTRLDSLFLDEGFGTLDPETLETVASAVEELGAGGRTIGVITHVREFADRLPVRFEVRKGPRGSVVERI